MVFFVCMLEYFDRKTLFFHFSSVNAPNTVDCQLTSSGGENQKKTDQQLNERFCSSSQTWPTLFDQFKSNMNRGNNSFSSAVADVADNLLFVPVKVAQTAPGRKFTTLASVCFHTFIAPFLPVILLHTFFFLHCPTWKTHRPTYKSFYLLPLVTDGSFLFFKKRKSQPEISVAWPDNCQVTRINQKQIKPFPDIWSFCVVRAVKNHSNCSFQ